MEPASIRGWGFIEYHHYSAHLVLVRDNLNGWEMGSINGVDIYGVRS
jgi:hypothetical protein